MTEKAPSADEWRVLAESAGFRIEHQYEDARLVDKATGQIVNLGDFYGDPDCAVIAATEQWFAVGGEGVITYDAQNGLRQYMRSTDPRSARAQTSFIAAMREDRSDVLRILVDPWDERPGTWELTVPSGDLVQISEGPDLRDKMWREDVPC